MIVWIQNYVDGTGDVKSKWTVYVAPNHLTLQELFNRVHAGKLFLFELFQTMVYTQVCTYTQGILIVHHVLKQPFLFLKNLWFLGYKKCSAYELSRYIYSLNY